MIKTLGIIGGIAIGIFVIVLLIDLVVSIADKKNSSVKKKNKKINSKTDNIFSYDKNAQLTDDQKFTGSDYMLSFDKEKDMSLEDVDMDPMVDDYFDSEAAEREKALALKDKRNDVDWFSALGDTESDYERIMREEKRHSVQDEEDNKEEKKEKDYTVNPFLFDDDDDESFVSSPAENNAENEDNQENNDYDTPNFVFDSDSENEDDSKKDEKDLVVEPNIDFDNFKTNTSEYTDQNEDAVIEEINKRAIEKAEQDYKQLVSQKKIEKQQEQIIELQQQLEESNRKIQDILNGKLLPKVNNDSMQNATMNPNGFMPNYMQQNGYMQPNMAYNNAMNPMQPNQIPNAHNGLGNLKPVDYQNQYNPYAPYYSMPLPKQEETKDSNAEIIDMLRKEISDLKAELKKANGEETDDIVEEDETTDIPVVKIISKNISPENLALIEENQKKLEVLLERKKKNDKELRSNKKAFVPLEKIRKSLEKDTIKLRKLTNQVSKAQMQVLKKGAKGIDVEKEQKLKLDEEMIRSLKDSIDNANLIMETNKDRLPVLRKNNEMLKDNAAKLDKEIQEITDLINKLQSL